MVWKVLWYRWSYMVIWKINHVLTISKATTTPVLTLERGRNKIDWCSQSSLFPLCSIYYESTPNPIRELWWHLFALHTRLGSTVYNQNKSSATAKACWVVLGWTNLAVIFVPYYHNMVVPSSMQPWECGQYYDSALDPVICCGHLMSCQVMGCPLVTTQKIHIETACPPRAPFINMDKL